jgi:hypothetical protein
MPLGPIEIVVLSFPENRFTGEILPELARVVDSGAISIIDGLLIRKNGDGAVDFFEIDQLGDNDVSALADLIHDVGGLISEDDVFELTQSLDPNSSAAILAFEHTWVNPLRDAIVASGGVLIENIRIPGVVADEVLAASLAAS